MKIIIVSQSDPFYIPLFFSKFSELMADVKNIQVDGVIIQQGLGKKSKISLARQMFQFYGLYHFITQSIKYCMRKCTGKLNSLGLLGKSFSIEYFVKKSGWDIIDYTNVNSSDFVDYVKENDIDLIVSVAASQIFKKEILEAPKEGCINIHNAPLPDYRGMLPNFWQMYHGEEYSVMTIHEMVEELDKGRIILQKKTKIEPDMSLDELIKKTKQKNAEALIQVLEMFGKGEVEYRDLPEKEGSYFSFPLKKDVAEFRRRGGRLF